MWCDRVEDHWGKTDVFGAAKLCPWTSFAAAHVTLETFTSEVPWSPGRALEWMYQKDAACDARKHSIRNTQVTRAPPKLFEVFTMRQLAFIVGRQTALSLMIDLLPYISEIQAELEDADEKQREPNIPPVPPLYPSISKGLFSAAKQATVTFVRWIMDNLVYLTFPTTIAVELLKDAKLEIGNLLDGDTPLDEAATGIYFTMFATYCTWVTAEVIVSVGLEVYLMGGKDRKISTVVARAKQHAYRCGILLFVDPLGAVVGGIASRAWWGAMLGFNVLDLFMASQI